MQYTYNEFKTITGPNLELSELRASDYSDLYNSLVDAETWFSKARNLNSQTAFENHLNGLLSRRKNGDALTLVARKIKSREVVATSTYFSSVYENFAKVEIGFTWVASSYHGSSVNTELKLLMLDYAFEKIKTARVEFFVHPTNGKSNSAVKKIGAKFEGLLRKSRFRSNNDDGHRNIYSIVDNEWPSVRENLILRLKRLS